MGVIAGSPVSASNTNQAFLDANGDDTALGKIDLANTLPESGATINNIQKAHNAISSYTGMPINSAMDVVPSYTNNDVGTNGETLRARADNLTQKFNNTAGHTHTGAAGDGPQIDSTDLASVVLRGHYLQGVNLTGVTGSSTNVTSNFSLETPSNNQTTEGVVVNPTGNQCILKSLAGDPFEDGSGNEVYGVLTESTGTWTLSYFSNVSGTPTAYSFVSSTTIQMWYQKLFNPITNAPVYSELTTVQSANTTADVIDASESAAGKVLLSNVVAQSVGSANVKGTATRVSKEDHVHQGVHSIFKTGDSQIYGDIEIAPGANATITRSGNKFTFDALGGVAYQETPGGVVNGVNASFGPLTYLPSNNDSIAVYVDNLIVPRSNYTVSSYTITFTSGNEPVYGQTVYCFYITSGIPALPPTPSGVLKTEFRTVTAPEAAAKIVVLAATPFAAGEVLVDIIGGTAQEFNVDYTVVGNEFRWNGYALDGVLSSGDKIRFHYIT